MSVRILEGDALQVLQTLPDCSVQMCVTSPPYFGLRDYGVVGQLGLEKTPDLYVEAMVGVFREVRRVLRDDGTLWLNIGDSYAGSGKGPSNSLQSPASQLNPGRRNTGQFANGQAPTAWVSVPAGCKAKDLIGIPWLLAFALRADGWYLRSDIIWSKPNPMPESVTDRPTKSHEYLFLLSKSPTYYYDADAIAEPVSGGTHGGASQPSTLVGRNAVTTQGGKLSSGLGLGWDKPNRNRRSVWTIPTMPYSEAHFATFPPDLIEPCIRAGSATNACEMRGCGAPWLPPGKRLYRPTCECGPPLTGSARSVVLDPFGGAGTTGLVADRLGRDAFLIELNPKYAEMARNRIHSDNPLFGDVA